jgi:hypothetical protein
MRAEFLTVMKDKRFVFWVMKPEMLVSIANILKKNFMP